MNISFTNKVAIVTGGESGIGKGIAEKLLSLGCLVYTTGINDEPEWCGQYNKCIYTKVDFLNQDSLDSFINEICQLSKIDILINNAGFKSCMQ